MAIRNVLLSVEKKLSGKKVYRVLDTDEVTVIYKSAPTHRDYVAIAGTENSAQYRFGRLDLIGKGDSRHFFNYNPPNGDVRWLAKFKEVSNG